MKQTDQNVPQGERLQKVLARMGIGSRREIEAWIAEGRVRVNGRVASLGDRVSPGDRIDAAGREVRLGTWGAPKRRVIVYNKPEGELVTRTDPEGRRTVFESLPRLRQGRWVPVGRLDLNTSGLLLLTTDGELANRLMHPSRELEREYAVRILGEVPPAELARLTQGVELEDGPARFERIQAAGGEGANRWYHVVLKEGRNREVRRLWETAGVRVSRLIRVRYGNVELGPRLFTGHWRELEEAELNGLLALAGMEAETPETPGRRRFGPPKDRPRQESGRPQRESARPRQDSGRSRQGTGRPGQDAGKPGQDTGRPRKDSARPGRSGPRPARGSAPDSGPRPGRRRRGAP